MPKFPIYFASSGCTCSLGLASSCQLEICANCLSSTDGDAYEKNIRPLLLLSRQTPPELRKSGWLASAGSLDICKYLLNSGSTLPPLPCHPAKALHPAARWLTDQDYGYGSLLHCRGLNTTPVVGIQEFLPPPERTLEIHEPMKTHVRMCYSTRQPAILKATHMHIYASRLCQQNGLVKPMFDSQQHGWIRLHSKFATNDLLWLRLYDRFHRRWENDPERLIPAGI